jgi:hypothetical protein
MRTTVTILSFYVCVKRGVPMDPTKVLLTGKRSRWHGKTVSSNYDMKFQGLPDPLA